MLPVLALLVLAPISAEHLIGYDDTVGKPGELIGALVLFVPLYGGAAVLTRELTRRAGRGWPTMLMLGFAFGLVQAGLLDQGLFNPAYRGIPYWEDLVGPTQVAGFGFSASMVLNFVVNHMIRSFCAPIAVIEACFPDRAGRPWLGRIGLAVVAVLYLAAAAFVLSYTLDTEDSALSPLKFAVTALLAVAITVAAFALPRRPTDRVSTAAPAPWLASVIAALALAVHLAVPPTWPGFAIELLVLAVLGILVARWSRRTGWGPPHVLAIGGASFLAHAALAFTMQPLGDPTATAKYITNAALALGVLALLAFAHRRLRGNPWPVVVAPALTATLVTLALLLGPCPDLIVMGGTTCPTLD